MPSARRLHLLLVTSPTRQTSARQRLQTRTLLTVLAWSRSVLALLSNLSLITRAVASAAALLLFKDGDEKVIGAGTLESGNVTFAGYLAREWEVVDGIMHRILNQLVDFRTAKPNPRARASNGVQNGFRGPARWIGSQL